ncbi:hypothetical protein AgCh_023107 [Apium graveolens]
MVPYVVDKMFGCDVVMDDDKVLEQAQYANLNNGDDSDAFDTRATTTEAEPALGLIPKPLAVVNSFAALHDCTDEEEGELLLSMPAGKKRKNKSQSDAPDASVTHKILAS